MNDGNTLENDDFTLDNENPDQGNQEQVEVVADAGMRRKLEAELEERRLQKMIQDYDFDLD